MILKTQYEHEIFQQAMGKFQLGAWAEGHALLDSLIERDPLNQDLRGLKNEMNLREGFEAQEVFENKLIRWMKVKQIAIRIGVIAVVLLMIGAALFIYSKDLSATAAAMRANNEKNINSEQHELAMQNAANLLAGNHYRQAKQILLEVQTTDPLYPNLDLYLAQANELEHYDKIYQDAEAAYASQDYQRAYELYSEVHAWRSGYQDVPQKLASLDNLFQQEALFKQAEKAYGSDDYLSAIPLYEQIQAENPEYRTDLIEERLFESYLGAANAVIGQDTQSLEALATAEEFFKKALSLRPQDEEIQTLRAKARKAFEVRLANSYVDQAQKALMENADSLAALEQAKVFLSKAVSLVPDDQAIRSQYELAVKYLQAIDSFESAGWDVVIERLEDVILVDPNFADHTAAQALYEAYMARARRSLAAGLFEAALEDLQRAVQVAGLLPSAIMQQFESTRWIADVYGLQGKYEEAVAVYRLAVELSDFGRLIQQTKPELGNSLLMATTYADSGKYREAYIAFRDVLGQSINLYGRTSYTVVEGDYLAQIAKKYNTTVQAILEANNLQATTALNRQILIIPFFPIK